jgi:hypothetical protein
MVLTIGFALPPSLIIAADPPKNRLPWEIRLELPKQVDVSIPLEDGKPARSKSVGGRWVHQPVAVVPVTIVVKNTGDRSLDFSTSDFDLEVLDPSGKKLFRDSDYEFAGPKDERREKITVKAGDSGKVVLTVHFVAHTPLDGQTYRIRVGPPDAEGTFVPVVKKHKWEKDFGYYLESVVEVRAGKEQASGTIFRYDPMKREAYALTIGTVMKDPKHLAAVPHWRAGRKIDSPKEIPAEVLVNFHSEFGVLRFALDSAPKIFPLARPGYDYSQLVDLISCRWNKDEGSTARLAAFYSFVRGGIGVVHSQPWEGIGGAALFDRYGSIVGIGVSDGGAHRGGLGVFADERRIREICDEEHFSLPRVGFLGAALDDTPKADRGVRIVEVIEGGPAARAGIRGGDIVEKWNGEAAEGVGELLRLIGLSEPGSKATVSMRRDGKPIEVAATVGEVPVPKQNK